MGIYEKVREFFGAFRGAYSRLRTYKNLVGKQRLQIDKISGLSEQISRQVRGLEDYVWGAVEQRTFLSNELANTWEQLKTTQAGFAETQTELLKYQENVKTTAEYLGLAKEKEGVETRVGDLEKQVSDLNNLCGLRNKTIKNLRIKLRDYDKEKIRQIESIYEQRAKGPDKHHSYFVIRGHLKIITSTPEFEKSFGYNDPNKPIKGLSLFKILKIPEDSPDYISQKQMKELLEDPKEIKLTTTIIDGKNEEKIIRFVKHIPESFEVGVSNLYYTTVETHEIGVVKRAFGKVLRQLHIINGKPKTISEFLKQHAISEVHSEAEKEKNEILSEKPEEAKPRRSWRNLRKNTHEDS